MCLASFTYYNALQIDPYFPNDRISFLRLNNILSYATTTFSLTDRHSVCFHNLAVVNSGSKDISLRYMLHYFGYIPTQGIARTYGNTIFNFSRNLHTISIVAMPTYISSTDNMYKGFFYSTSLSVLTFTFL